MPRYKRPMVIASRQSPLAQAQARAVGGAVARLNPGLDVRYHWVVSQGDRFAHAPLADIGGKGLFTSEVERAILAGQADVAVHSCKDMPAAEQTPGLTIVAIPSRGDVRDALITRHGGPLDDLPHGATVGTASPRRAAQIQRLRPDVTIKPIRGNVQTRMRKVLVEGQFDATLLAVAGMHRAGLADQVVHVMDPLRMLPAAGQGALAIQCRRDDHATFSRCLALNDPMAAQAVHAERHVVAGLEGDCHSPIAVLVEPIGNADDPQYRIHARVLSPDGRECLEEQDQAPISRLTPMAQRVTDALKRDGAGRVLCLE